MPTIQRAGRGRPLARHALLIALVACSEMALAGVAHTAAAKDRAPTQTATVPTAFEMQLFYADRTWNWQDGAAYFAQDRRLRAWTAGPDSTSIAEGRWLLTSNGKMCMELVWRSTAYAATPIRTCFSHRIQDGNVEQRKDPDGGWYSFKHASDDASGEHRKFQEGDAKNIEFETARKLVDPKG
ncbi:DUF995 domain-containing protein [Mesorhizobium abyssinicae]|uniref:DUF995 domain-containing protein n=1 Tax=Mesorhizobium abyssinicae TaxID=1209958 RepID=A0ABU5AU30_9HYPH|nr:MULTISPECIES: DUF995 domain-containing protein [Mesorhizobium]MDX8433802.1 DUF995 domain-containing protein [Mesorhizobium abyssinicae]MDX8540819.1 DUF995 domain-containing protein [Mesorhizobium abyssinicae]